MFLGEEAVRPVNGGRRRGNRYNLIGSTRGINGTRSVDRDNYISCSRSVSSGLSLSGDGSLYTSGSLSLGGVSHARADGSDTRKEGRPDGWNRNGNSKTKTILNLPIHGLSGSTGSINSLSSRVSTAIALLETSSRAISVLTHVLDGIALVASNSKVIDLHVSAGDVSGAVEFDGSSLMAIGAGSGPAGEGHVGVENTVAGDGLHGAPLGIEVEGVGVGVASEVLESNVVDGAAAAIGLEHVHLVRTLGVDVVVLDIVNI